MNRKQAELLESAMRAANDRSRLLYAIGQVFSAIGVPANQSENIIRDVRAANFDSLHKLLKKSQKRVDKSQKRD